MTSTQYPHYLPRQTHLRYFEDPRRPGFIWLYKRGAEPVQVSFDNVAKERNIWPREVEDALTSLENATQPLLERLINEPGEARLTAEEEAIVAEFAALQFARVPAQRRVMQQLTGSVAKLQAQAQAFLAPEAFEARIEEARAKGDLPADIDVAEIRRVLQSPDYQVIADQRYGMALSLQMAESLVPTFLMKRLVVVRSEAEYFITCDTPVVQIPDPDAPPMYSGGFLMTHVFFPIGRRTGLIWILDDRKEPAERADQSVIIRSKRLGGASQCSADCKEHAGTGRTLRVRIREEPVTEEALRLNGATTAIQL